MAKTFKQFYQTRDAKEAKVAAETADKKTQKRTAKFFNEDVEEEPSIVEVDDVDLDEETYQKYLIRN